MRAEIVATAGALWLGLAAGSCRADTQAAVAEVLAEQHLVGAVWATLDPVNGVRLGAGGLKDAGVGTPLSPHDRVQVGSIAKTVLALGVLRLVSQGRLALDMPLHEALPAPAVDNAWHPGDPVRLRHLLDHTACLDDARLWQVFSTRASPGDALTSAFPADALPRVRCRPGTRHSYSNTGYTLLGLVIEHTSGERYERYLAREVLQPLGLHDSLVDFVSQQGAHADPRLASGHLDDGRTHPAVPTFLRPATQFTTTAADMARLAQFLLGDGRIGAQVFIDSSLMLAMGEPHDTEAANAGLAVGYGLGLARRDRHGAIGRCHGGSTVGFRAMLCVYRESQRAFFFAANMDNELADYTRLERVLVDALAFESPARPIDPVVAFDASSWQGWYVPAPNRFATLAWLDRVFGATRLIAEPQGLRLLPLQGAPLSLVALGAGRYRAPGRTVASHVLLRDREGDAVLSTGLQNHERIATWKLAALWLSLALTVLGLLWVWFAGMARLLARRLRWRTPVFVPVMGTLALALPLPFFLAQSFVQLGDVTPASVLLAGATALLPLAMLVGLAQQFRARPHGIVASLDNLAMLSVLQGCAVLAAWGLLPLRLWA